MTGLAAMLGVRFMGEEVVASVFREEMEMVKKLGFIERWLAEEHEHGEVQEARRMLLRFLRARLGEVPNWAVERIEAADRAWCEQAVDRAATIQQISDLF